MKDDLVWQLQKVGIRLAAAEGFSEDACGGLKKLKVQKDLRVTETWRLLALTGCSLQDEDVRIIVGFFREDFASEVFCCVSFIRTSDQKR